MTFRLSMIAAVLVLFSSVAQASDLTTSTDDARARAAVTSNAGAAAPVAAASRAPATTDEARALARVASPSTASHPQMALYSAPASTDEARALAAGGLLTLTRPAEQKAASACTCKHG